MRRISLLALTAFLMAAGCRQAPREPPSTPPPFKPAASVLELMTSVVDPSADVLWASVGTIMTEDGVEEIFPRTEEEWVAIENACVVLMESGNLLMIGDRAVDNGAWMENAQALVDAGQLALEAARARDPDEIFAIGGEVYAVCDSCHQSYWVEGADFQSDTVEPTGGTP